MPIYEYYCPDNNTVYQFFARTLAQGAKVPRCPDNPSYTMERVLSSFAITGPGKPGGEEGAVGESAAAKGEGDPRMEAALSAMEGEFSSVDENDPRAMGRMMRRLSELTGEKIEGEMEEVVRKLEEGADPEELEESLGAGEAGEGMDDETGMGGGEGPEGPGGPMEAKHRYRARRRAPYRDPKLYDYES